MCGKGEKLSCMTTMTTLSVHSQLRILFLRKHNDWKDLLMCGLNEEDLPADIKGSYDGLFLPQGDGSALAVNEDKIASRSSISAVVAECSR